METIYKPLVVNTINDLADKDFTNSAPLVEGFLPSEGAFLFCGSSKIGKSWLALYLALRVSTGEKFWDLDVKKTSVLYLCLEDGERRLHFNIQGALFGKSKDITSFVKPSVTI